MKMHCSLRNNKLLSSRKPPRRRNPMVCRAQRMSRKHVLVLPGFLSGSRTYKRLEESLKHCGYSAGTFLNFIHDLRESLEVLKIDAKEWYPSLLGFSFDWYIDRLSEAIDYLFAQHGKLILVGHSAAGWIARLCLGEEPYMGLRCGQIDKVEKLITLGTPHLSLEQYPFGRFKEKIICNVPDLPEDVKASSLRFANFFYGNAIDLDPVYVACVIGTGFKGVELKFLDRVKYVFSQGKVPPHASKEGFAYTSYKLNCSKGDTIGDGVCPVESSLLPGAEHLVLHGVYHGPNKYGLDWYGSKEVVEEWTKALEL